MQKAEDTTLTRALADFVSNAPVICEEVGQVVFDGGFILYLTFVGKKHQVAGYTTEVHQLRYFKFWEC